MRRGDYVAITLLLVLACLFATLGRWQLQRAETNRSIEARFSEAEQLPVLELPLVNPTDPLLRYRRIRVAGHYESRIQILLDNMTSAGTAGYQVLTPLRTNAGRLLLINRGWVAADPDRRILPELPVGDAAVVIEGRIAQLPTAALRLGSPEQAAPAPLVRMSFPDYDAIATVLGSEVEEFQVLMDASAADGFVRDWAPDFDRDERNIAYAVQWFALAALAFAIGLGVFLRARRRG